MIILYSSTRCLWRHLLKLLLWFYRILFIFLLYFLFIFFSFLENLFHWFIFFFLWFWSAHFINCYVDAFHNFVQSHIVTLVCFPLYLSNQQVLLCPHESQTFTFCHLLFWCSICFQKLWSASHLLVFLSIACREFYQCCLWALLYFECEPLYALHASKRYLSIWNPLTLFEPFLALSCSFFQQLHSVEVS